MQAFSAIMMLSLKLFFPAVLSVYDIIYKIALVPKASNKAPLLEYLIICRPDLTVKTVR